MYLRVKILRRIVAAVVAVTALGVLATPASAAQSVAAGAPAAVHGILLTHSGSTVVISSGANTLKTGLVSPNFSACGVTAFGYSGKAICGTIALTTTHDGSHQEAFVIGLDWAIWHAWPGSNGWHSLGGQALHFTGTDSSGRNSGVFQFQDDPLMIGVWGTNGSPYCNIWGAPWSGWFAC